MPANRLLGGAHKRIGVCEDDNTHGNHLEPHARLPADGCNGPTV
jgi:hypothetical protein